MNHSQSSLNDAVYHCGAFPPMDNIICAGTQVCAMYINYIYLLYRVT